MNLLPLTWGEIRMPDVTAGNNRHNLLLRACSIIQNIIPLLSCRVFYYRRRFIVIEISESAIGNIKEYLPTESFYRLIDDFLLFEFRLFRENADFISRFTCNSYRCRRYDSFFSRELRLPSLTSASISIQSCHNFVCTRICKNIPVCRCVLHVKHRPCLSFSITRSSESNMSSPFAALRSVAHPSCLPLSVLAESAR